MFTWDNFRKLALSCNAQICASDEELIEILMLENPPPSQLNSCGQPQPGNTLINMHPHPMEFIRTLEIRKKLAIDDNNAFYSEYAEQLLVFLKSLPTNASLYIVNLATKRAYYEFAYSPASERVFGSRVLS